MDRHPRVELPLEAPHTLAVVVPCFSHAAYLPDLLESIAAQTRRPNEVIFVDDASRTPLTRSSGRSSPLTRSRMTVGSWSLSTTETWVRRPA